MAAGAGVALEDDVAAFVEGETVVLVGDGAVLDGQVGGGDIKSVAETKALSVQLLPFAIESQDLRIVASSLTTRLAVLSVTGSYTILW